MLNIKLAVTIMIGKVLSLQAQSSSRPANSLNWESCNYGDAIRNTCNYCVCSSNGVYNCEPRECLTYEQDFPTSSKQCHPKIVYHQGSTDCICTPEGRWPHTHCYHIFGNLPKKSISKKTCDSEGYVKIDCNVCKCNDEGEIDTTRCTLNECDKGKARTRKSKDDDTTDLFANCKVANWYSMAACQFCYCLDTNKLTCSTGIKKKIVIPLGENELTLCGPGLLKQLTSLLPDNGFNPFTYSNFGKHLPFNDMPIVRANLTESEIQTQTNFKNNYPESTLKETPNNLHVKMPPKFLNYDPRDAFRKVKKFRKSIYLDPRANCKPGIVTSVKCNICHCLTNGKMICTNNKCGY